MPVLPVAIPAYYSIIIRLSVVKTTDSLAIPHGSRLERGSTTVGAQKVIPGSKLVTKSIMMKLYQSIAK